MDTAQTLDLPPIAIAVESPEAMQSQSGLFVLDGLIRLLLAVWFGSMVSFSFLVAPIAFGGILPNRYWAGVLVGMVLGSLEAMGIVVGLTLAVLMAGVAHATDNLRKRTAVLSIVLSLLAVADCVVSKWYVSAPLDAMRDMYGFGGAGSKAGEHLVPMFNRYHQYSVWLMTFNMLACAALIILHMKLTEKRSAPRA